MSVQPRRTSADVLSAFHGGSHDRSHLPAPRRLAAVRLAPRSGSRRRGDRPPPRAPRLRRSRPGRGAQQPRPRAGVGGGRVRRRTGRVAMVVGADRRRQPAPRLPLPSRPQRPQRYRSSTRAGSATSTSSTPRTSPSLPATRRRRGWPTPCCTRSSPIVFARSDAAADRPLPEWAIPAAWDDPLDPSHPGRSRQLYGGDLDGVVDRLDHLVDLGVNALYHTPIFPAESNHRYGRRQLRSRRCTPRRRRGLPTSHRGSAWRAASA